ncbi:PREDICTED: leucine-rich repeat and calponin homology domain-containing protein 3 [Nanorana parkeri]|uniref:leucine-rich repeat and calponin homology domain-containing protein 3 n=1 Tax=Nanorana parkeri TaxID=125878 RepID=UPI0008544BED|nr:PREDICTED: leucine-rich repeat and calponin homology domain-containing protein 3 [Nanorana parkeri]
MAATVLAEGSAVPGFSAMVFNGHSATSAPGTSAGPAAWNRSLERALEEAAVTGFLNLSGRKLREFPRSAVRQDLSDTTQADVSRNRLSEIPAEICHYVSLESLNLYQNCIRYVPEATLNLQALTFLNLSRNQLTSLPGYICSLPLKVLIASNNKLDSLPEEIGLLRHLTELDVSCNEVQTIPTQIGKLESLRDLNIRRNLLLQLPEEIADLPLVRLDFSCNKVTSIPVCYRNLRHLQTIILDNNPLQSPPAQICIKGKIHIFKYLNIEACKNVPDLPEYDRRPGFGSCHDDVYPGRTYGALDSGFNSVDSGDKRWSGNEPTDEFTDLPIRTTDASKEQRLRRDHVLESRGNSVIANGGVEHDLDQIDYIDSYATEEEEEDVRQSKGDSLSSQFMAYIEERRTTQEGSPLKQNPTRESQRAEDIRRHLYQSRISEELRRPESLSLTNKQRQPSPRRQNERSHLDAMYLIALTKSPNQTDTDLQPRPDVLESARRQAQLAAQQYEEERLRDRITPSESLNHRALSPEKQSPLDNECSLPSRRSQHTDDSALLVSDERSSVTPVSPTSQTIHLSSPASASSYHSSPQRPESFLFRAAVREDVKRSNTPPPATPSSDGLNSASSQSSRIRQEEQDITDQLRKNIESRLKLSLPSDLGAALTDGVVLCHLANHVRPRSVPSIHVPSPAVPKLTMAKCRRNVENFLEACKKIGVPQDKVCLPSDILHLNLCNIKGTLESLLSFGEGSQAPALSSHLLGFGVFYCTLMLLLYLLYRWVLTFWTQA